MACAGHGKLVGRTALSQYGPAVTYLSPLGYLLGVEGVALLRGFREGTADRAFVEERIGEIRQLLADPGLAAGVEASGAIGVDEVYRDWAPHYDEPNTMIDLEEPAVRRILLPLADDSVDVVVCGLALAYLPALGPAFGEFARVLRPGGQLVVSDAHLLLSYLRPTLTHRAAGGAAAVLAEYHRPLSDYLGTALPLGFQVRHCEELSPRRGTGPRSAPDPSVTDLSWELLRRCPGAAEVALGGSPTVVVWHFQYR